MSQWTRSNATRKTRSWGGSVVLLALAGALLVAAGHGCSADRRYKVLSFFFDGVPDPNAPKPRPGERTGEDASGQPIKIYVHKPYADNQCGSCHSVSTGQFADFNRVESTVCVNCHAKVLTAYPVMHGPVTSVQCNLCHNPHESSEAGLLREAPPAVCTQCHIPELLPSTPPEHLAADSACLQCHVGHGSTQHKLLRNLAAATTKPATAPSARESGAVR